MIDFTPEELKLIKMRKQKAADKALKDFHKVFTEGKVNREEVKTFLNKYGITIEEIL